MELKNYINKLDQITLNKLIEAVVLDESILIDIVGKLNDMTHYYQEFDSPFLMERGSIARKLILSYYPEESIESINFSIGGVYPLEVVFNNHIISIVILDANFEYPYNLQPSDEFVILLKAKDEDQLDIALEFLTSILL